eukprot:COSAG05_NODE_297_length_11939_cov_17.362753_3_plen_389_part_00
MAEALEASLITSTSGWHPSKADVATALRLTSKDPKYDHAAARKLLNLGQDSLREADAALRVEAKGWTLHWSNSQSNFFYANRAARLGPYLKNEECPFGWACDAGGAGGPQYFHVTKPEQKQPEPPTKKRSLGSEDPADAEPGGDPSKRLKLAAGAVTKSVVAHGWHNGEGPLVKWNPVPEGWERKSLAERVRDLCAMDDRVGYPSAVQPVEKNPHGWFFPPHKVVMANIMNERTTCIMELGSWLGKSTRFIQSRAPNAFIMCIDLWSNDHIRADPHYTENEGESEFMANNKARARQIEENFKIIDEAPIYDVFLKNMEQWRSSGERPPPPNTHIHTGCCLRAIVAQIRLWIGWDLPCVVRVLRKSAQSSFFQMTCLDKPLWYFLNDNS